MTCDLQKHKSASNELHIIYNIFFKNMLLLYQYIINYQEVDSNKSFFKESYHERFEGLRPSCSCVYEPAL